VASHGPFPALRGLAPLRDGTPVTRVMGDSHAALFAHAGWRPGRVKATYGTGSSIMSLGDPPGGARRALPHGGVGRRRAGLAFEGNIRSTGATLTWLAEFLGTTPAALAEAPRRPATASTSSPASAASARRGGTTARSACSAG
jgi:glycerol kinase